MIMFCGLTLPIQVEGSAPAQSVDPEPGQAEEVHEEDVIAHGGFSESRRERFPPG